MTRYTTQCFSGGCGFCSQCCGSASIILDPTEESGASDMKLLYGRKILDEISNDYNIRLNRWCAARGYKNPTDSGWTEETLNKYRAGSIEPIKFHLVRESHEGQICCNLLCRVLYEDANEWLRKKNYSIMPLYSWKDEKCDKKYICGPCMDYKGDF